MICGYECRPMGMSLRRGLCSRGNLSKVDVEEELANVDVNGACSHISKSGRSRCKSGSWKKGCRWSIE